MDSWRYDIFVLLTGYRQFRQTPCTLWLKKKRQCRAVKELVKAVIKLIVQNNCVLLTIRIIVQNHYVLLTLWQCICTHVFVGSPWRDMYHSLLHAILQVHKMFPEAALPTIVPYTDILWARHAILLPRERLLNPREHSLPFVCLHPDHGCWLCLKDQLEITLKLL